MKENVNILNMKFPDLEEKIIMLTWLNRVLSQEYHKPLHGEGQQPNQQVILFPPKDIHLTGIKAYFLEIVIPSIILVIKQHSV